jgi:hypothetical protein
MPTEVVVVSRMPTEMSDIRLEITGGCGVPLVLLEQCCRPCVLLLGGNYSDEVIPLSLSLSLSLSTALLLCYVWLLQMVICCVFL